MRIDSHDEFTMKAEILPGTDNVGHIYLRGFGPVKTIDEEKGKTSEEEKVNNEALERKLEYASNIRKLKEGNAEHVIIDLRENDGGSPDSEQLLCSYFMEENIELSSTAHKNLENPNEPILETYKTLSYKDIPKEDRLLGIPIYLLSSKKTFSACEKFIFDMTLARANVVVVGETTKGGANPGSELNFGELHDSKGKLRKLDIVIPTGTTLPFKGHSNWERNGISPDLKTAPDDAFDTALKLIKEK